MTDGTTTAAHRLQILHDLLPLVGELLPTLKTVEDSWQPSDFLPDFGAEGWREDLDNLREEAAALTDAMLVVLVGNIVTEEALPSYQVALNRLGVPDQTGVDSHEWARWSRGWTAEEKRHGDVTRAYLYLSGRVDMRSVERTIQYLIRNGFAMGDEGDPFRGVAYASIQEHATKTSWRQLGNIVRKEGARRLHQMCGLIAADEARHERVYRKVMAGILEADPQGALEALNETLGVVTMPAKHMSDGVTRQLFQKFTEVGARLGVYGMRDYAENVEGFIKDLDLETRCGLVGDANRYRDNICGLPSRYRRAADAMERSRSRPMAFQWIHGRSV